MKVTKLEMPDGTLTKIEGGDENGVEQYIRNFYSGMQRVAEVTSDPGGVLPLPFMNFAQPDKDGAEARQPAPVCSGLVGNEEPLPLPAMTF